MTSWNEFEVHLARGLRSVSDRVYLIIRSATDKARHVQFAAEGDRLDAQASGAALVADANEGALRDAGWQSPTHGEYHWESPLRVPALTAEFRELARRCVIALRDAHGISSPNDLVYTAWRDAEIRTDAHGSGTHQSELDRGDLDLQIPALNLPREIPPQSGRG